MRTVRKECWAVFVWATATSTLIASTPHFVCRCPDGTIKEFCFGCCGGKTCCSTKGGKGSCCKGNPSGEKGPKHVSCCQAKRGQPDRRGSVNGSSVSQKCCERTLAQTENLSVNREDAKVNASLSHCFAIPSETVLGQFTQINLPAHTAWQVYRVPPPTKLVVTLLHLVI